MTEPGTDKTVDADQLETLRTWAEGLSQDHRSEVKAAAKAILLLCEEVERLHIELWKSRSTGASGAARGEQGGSEEDVPGERRIEKDLRARLARLRDLRGRPEKTD